MSSKRFALKGRCVVKGVVEGTALVTKQRISAFLGIDPETGRIIEKGHAIEGKNIKGRILVFPYGKGSNAWGGFLYAACNRGNGPAAIINNRIDSFVINGAIVTGTPMIIVSDHDPCEIIESGDHVRVNAEKGIVEIVKRRNKE